MALSPTSSHPAAFTGGTIAGPVIIDPGANVSNQLRLTHGGLDYFDAGSDGAFFAGNGSAGGSIQLVPSQSQAFLAATGSCDVTARADSILLDLPANGKLYVYDHNFAARLIVDEATGKVATAPPASEASTLALGTAYQHATDRDVLLVIYLSVTVNTSGVLKLGVGPTATPTQQTLVTGLTATGLWPVPIYLPAGYYALLSVTGTITVAVDGQIAIPI